MDKVVSQHFTQDWERLHTVEEMMAESKRNQVSVLGETLSILMEAHGKYRGIPYKINAPTGSYKFTYYIYLREEFFQNPDDFADIVLDEEIVNLPGGGSWASHKYYDCWLADLDWHGGITYYKRTDSGGKSYIEAGCDYAHLWDEEEYYSLASVITDVHRTIDSLFNFKPMVENECKTPQTVEA